MIIYLTTNLINGYIYIGKDKYNDDEYFGSGKIIKRAINKNGKQNFKKEIICYCSSEDEMNFLEIFCIYHYRQLGFKMYNISSGGDWGDTFTHNPEKEIIRKKISIKIKDKYANGWVNPMKGKISPFKYRSHTEDAKLQNSKKQKDKYKNHNFKNPFKDKHHTLEFRKQQSIKKKNDYATCKIKSPFLGANHSGKNNGMYDKNHSDRSKRKISIRIKQWWKNKKSKQL